MDSPVLTFGDVFSVRGIDYVFLAAPADLSIVYAAKILTTDESRLLITIHERQQHQPDFDHRSPVFCFVILQSELYQQRVAHLRDTELRSRVNRPHERLSTQDRQSIRTEILEGSVPPLLKELVEPLEV